MGTLLALIFCAGVLWWAFRWTVREVRNRPAPMPHPDNIAAAPGLTLQQSEALARLEKDVIKTEGAAWARLEALMV